MPGPSLLSVDRVHRDPVPKVISGSIRGSISYSLAADKVGTATDGTGGIIGSPNMGVVIYGGSSITLQDVIRVMSPNHPLFDTRMGFSLTRRAHNCPSCLSQGEPCTSQSAQNGCLIGGVIQPDNAAFVVTNNTANRLTSIRGTKSFGNQVGDTFGVSGGPVGGYANESDWTVTGKSQGNCATGSTASPCTGTHTTAVQSPWQNTSTNGARLCYRTENGVTGTTPLWPWPMNERIVEATTQAGKYAGPCSTNCRTNGNPWMSGAGNDTAPPILTNRPARLVADVTADIESLLGTIPAACRSDTPPATWPDATGYNPASLSTF